MLFLKCSLSDNRGAFAWATQEDRELTNDLYQPLEKKIFYPSEYTFQKENIHLKSDERLWWLYTLKNKINIFPEYKALLYQNCKSYMYHLIYSENLKPQPPSDDIPHQYITDSFERLASCSYRLKILNHEEQMEEIHFKVLPE